MSTIVIDPKQEILTFINVFHCEPENQDEVVRLVDSATGQVIRHMEGFISASLHASEDGTVVVNYVQWTTRELFEELFKNPDAVAHMKAIHKLVQSSKREYYKIASTYDLQTEQLGQQICRS